MHLTKLREKLRLDTLKLNKKSQELDSFNSTLLVKQLELNTKNNELRTILGLKEVELKKLEENLELANKPIIEIVRWRAALGKKVGIYIENTGAGTAYIKNYDVYYKDHKFESSEDRPFWLTVADSLKY